MHIIEFDINLDMMHHNPLYFLIIVIINKDL